MDINAKAEFQKVVRALAVSTKSLKERLRNETSPIFFVKESHVPEDLKSELAWIKSTISDDKLAEEGGESAISRIVSLSYRLPDSN